MAARGRAIRECFLQAVTLGDIGQTRKLLKADNLLVKAYWEQQTALHLASEKGHLDICCQLLEFGADKDSVDLLQQTALHLASSEGHFDICCLLLESGVDKDSADTRQQTALHLASIGGHFDICRLLLELGANKDRVNREQQTALHLASEKGHLDICHVLLEFGADKDSVDMSRQTALHLASEKGHLDICHLLLKFGAEKDSVDIRKWTPFLTATYYGHVPVMQLLKSVNCNVEARDEDNNGALAIASKWGRVGAVEFLAKNGFSVNEKHEKKRTALHSAAAGPEYVQHLTIAERVCVAKILLENKADAGAVDEDGERPYDLQLATGDLKSMLIKAYEDQMNIALSFSEGTVELSDMKLCVIGSEGSGKSTFTESLKRGKLQSMFTYESQRDDPHSIEQCTVGIAVSTVDVPGVGHVSVYDVAGQNQFHKTHGFFFAANAFFILLLSLVIGGEIRDPHQLYEEAKYWLCFLRASIGKKIVPTVIMAASRLDRCPRGGEILQQLADHLRRVFAGKIIISLNTFALDCRKASTRQMTGLRQHLRDLKMQNKVLYPRLCEPVITKVLPALRQQQQDLFINTSQLVAAIKEQSPTQDQQTIDRVIMFLDDCSELMYFGELTILDIPFLCMFILGPLLAPDNFPYHLVGKYDGVATKEDILHVLEAFQAFHKKSFTINVDTIIHLLKTFNLTFAVEGKPSSYLFPAHLPVKKLSVMWRKEATKEVYVGRQACCIYLTSIFSPGAFHLFQCRAYTRLDNQAQLWKDGIIVARAETVQGHAQCLVHMSKPLGAVDFVCRCAKGSESECMSLLRDVMALWKDVIEDHSPGTEYEVGYLSRQHLTEHREKVAVYSQEQVDEVKEKGPKAAVRRVTRDDEVVESLSDLMVFMTPQPDEEQYPSAEVFSAVFRAVVKHGQAQWFGLGLKAGFSIAEIQSLTHDKAMCSDKLLAIIQLKINEVGVPAAEELFLDACHSLPYPIHAAVMDELKATSRK